MTLDNEQIVDLVELIAYAPLFPLVLYLAWCHGRHGILGYFYLSAACTLRVVYDIVSLFTHTSNAEPPSMGTTILGSVGLTPLLLALAGFTHEAHLALLSARGPVGATMRKWLWFAQAQIHGISIVGIVLVIIGNVKLVTASNSKSEIQTDDHLRSAGAVILLVLCTVLTQYSIWLLWQWQSMPRSTVGGRKAMAQFNFLAALIIIAKMAYTVAYTFDPSNDSINPVTGTLAIKIVFNVLVPLAAVCALATGGWKSRGYKNELTIRRSESGSDTEYESLRFEGRQKTSVVAR